MKVRSTTRTELVKFHQIMLRQAEQHLQMAKLAVIREHGVAAHHRKAIERLDTFWWPTAEELARAVLAALQEGTDE